MAVADFSPRKASFSQKAVIVGFVVGSIRVALAPSLSTSVICQSSVQNAVELNISSILTFCSLLSNFTTRHFLFLSNSSTKCLTLCTDELAREWSVHQFVGPEPALSFLGKNIKKITKCWLVNQQMILWHGLTSTQRLARELISDPLVLLLMLTYCLLVGSSAGQLMAFLLDKKL